MNEWDAIIIGGGPAGLTAGLYLCRGKFRTLLIEKGSVGGYIMNVELIENYPGFPDGIPGAELGMQMKEQALRYGLEVERAEAIAVQASASRKVVTSASGSTYACKALIIAGGSRPRKLGVPGEERFWGSGVITCAFCDGGLFTDRVIAVCGGGDSGITEALYMANLASRVIVIEAKPSLTATAVLQERARANPKIEIRCSTRVTAILGDGRVTGIEVSGESGGKEVLPVDGVLVHVGLEPNTGYLAGSVPLDEGGQVQVNTWLETPVPGVFAAGDIRSGSPRQVSAAVGDGAIAAISAQRFLQRLT
ncbi:MAG: FAD-dependent oxidoreductase [Dehalococcoidales bacterium]|nr:FAD-dependent oxidoreductase [Dehalococcoidales bacterium]